MSEYRSKKSQLPSKLCVTCGLAFSWRKKWARDWQQVKYCSKRCSRDAATARSSMSND